ncbi:MAG: carboxypeptidase-like regulatory domain-containing protein, partial [Mangrovibacterium sp.]
MKKKCSYLGKKRRLFSTKLMLIMRLTLFFMVLGILSSSAKSWSQQTNLNLDYKSTSIKQILKDIEDGSNYNFVYSNNDFNVEREVDLKVRDASIEKILDQLLDGSGMGYRMVDRVIIITPSNVNSLSKVGSQISKTIKGKVTDPLGLPLPGVTVIIKGTSAGTITGADGTYSLTNVSDHATLVFSFIGMRLQEIAVGNNSVIDVTMQEETIGIEEVVAVGYGTQRKATLTGAVSAVKGEDIITTKNENAQNMLAGKISGVRVTQKTAEPGSFNNNFDIRAMGSPLIIIDGIPRTNDDFQRLDPNDIDNMLCS